MELFLLPTGPVDNFVENRAKKRAKARLVGLPSGCPCFDNFEKRC
jgi:hypothetical protein